MNALRYGSVCSGIESATVAWHPLGWQPQFFSEIDAGARAVLQHRWPEVPLHGDFTTIQAGDYGPIDLLVGGTPCQDFSVAGLRGGLAGERGNLSLEFLRLAQRLGPRWVVWENVPGVLSSGGGRDFGAILGGLVELGYGFAYRVLDAQYIRVDGFGRAVPQRRRRVFVVGHLGDWRRAAAVLFERACLRGDLAPRREAGARIAGCFTPGAHPGGFNGQDAYSNQLVAHSLRGEGFDASEDGTGRGTPIVPIAFDTTQITSAANRSAPQPGDPCHPLAAGAHPPAIAFFCKDHGADATDEGATPTLRAMGHSGSHANAGGQMAVAYGISCDAFDRSGEGAGGSAAERSGLGITEGVSPTIKAKRPNGVAADWAVRRLTPLECERLQGFPDGYTRVPTRGGAGWAADGPRYKQLGNSKAVNAVRWLGRRIAMVEALPHPSSTGA